MEGSNNEIETAVCFLKQLGTILGKREREENDKKRNNNKNKIPLFK